MWCCFQPPPLPSGYFNHTFYYTLFSCSRKRCPPYCDILIHMATDILHYLLASVATDLNDTPPRVMLVIIHVIGVALGVGGASACDIIFFKSIRDNQVTRV